MKTNRLLVIMVAVMMIFGVISPVSAETVTVETEIGNYDKTFDSYADFAALQAADANWTMQNGGVTLETESEANKAIKLTTGGKKGPRAYYNFQSMSSGTLKISFRTKGYSNGFIPYVKGTVEDGSYTESYLGMMSAANRTVCLCTNSQNADTSLGYVAAVEQDEWYTWEATIDMDATTVMKGMVIKNSAGTVIAERTDYQLRWASSAGKPFKTLNGFGVLSWETGNYGVYVDDVVIRIIPTTVTPDPEPVVDNYTFTQDFDSYDSYDALAKAEGKWSFIRRGNETIEIVDDPADAENNVAMIKVANANNQVAPFFRFTPDKPWTNGKIELSYKIKTSEVGNAFVLLYGNTGEDTKTKTYFTTAIRTSGLISGNGKDTPDTTDPAIAINEWYTVNAVYDLDNDTQSVVLTGKDADGNDVNKLYNSKIDITKLDCVNFQMWANAVGTTYYDDVVIKITLPTPKVTASSVTLENVFGETVDGLTGISPSIKTIKIDFGVEVDDATISASTVKLVKDGETDGVSYTGSYSAGVYTMTLDEILDGSSKYTLFVSKDITNEQGNGMESDANIEITTGKARVDTTINSIVIDDAEVQSIAGLTQDASATINIGYSNSTKTEKTVCVIVAYYDGNLLVGSDYIKNLSIPADGYTGTLYVPHTVLSTTDVDLVKVMVWDGLGTMCPLAISYPVSAQ